MKEQPRDLILAHAHCTIYNAKVDYEKLPKFSEDFKTAATKWLAQDSNLDQPHKFIDFFGTHYIDSIEFGAKYVLELIIDRPTRRQLQSEGLPILTIAAGLARGFSPKDIEHHYHIPIDQTLRYDNLRNGSKSISYHYGTVDMVRHALE